jgi:hypothetical protein
MIYHSHFNLPKNDVVTKSIIFVLENRAKSAIKEIEISSSAAPY